MKFTPRFLVDFKNYKKETMLAMAQRAVDGTKQNPDFAESPVKWDDFSKANAAMVAASSLAVNGNQAGLAAFRPLRTKVEGYMRQLAQFAQPRIGDNPERRLASGLPLSKAPEPTPTDLEVPAKATATQGKVEGEAIIWVKPSKAAKGIYIEQRLPDKTFKEVGRPIGFRATLRGLASDEPVVFRVRYWNALGNGPVFGSLLAVVPK